MSDEKIVAAIQDLDEDRSGADMCKDGPSTHSIVC